MKTAKCMLELPWLGKFVKNTITARFSRCFAVAIESGVPLLVSLDIAQGVVGNRIYAKKMNVLKQSIQHC
jgi:MSHA biogenesis protein MshG